MCMDMQVHFQVQPPWKRACNLEGFNTPSYCSHRSLVVYTKFLWGWVLCATYFYGLGLALFVFLGGNWFYNQCLLLGLECGFAICSWVFLGGGSTPFCHILWILNGFLLWEFGWFRFETWFEIFVLVCFFYIIGGGSLMGG